MSIALSPILQTCALNPPKTALLAFTVQAFHSVLDLVQGLLLSVKPLQPNQIISVYYEIAFDGQIERRVGGKRRAKVDFQKPRLQIRIDQHIKAQDFKTVSPVSAVFPHLRLDIIFAA